MSSLFNVYEPKDLNSLLANENNKTILQGFLKQKEIPQSYLFVGDRGCGKSLTAKLVAKQLNCQDNIQVLDCISDRSIEEIRRLIISASYRALDNNPKAFIMEEAHQLPKLSQEGFLTPLQTPPKNTYFFFTTTEERKIESTITSRSKRLVFEKIAIRELYPYLINISIKENNEISKTVARKICETSNGHIRDALSILEIVLQFKDEEKQIEVAGKELEEDKTIIDLCRLLLKSNSWNEISNILKQLQKNNVESYRHIILAYMQKILLSNPTKKVALIIDIMRNPYYDYEVFCCDIYQIFLGI